MKTQVRDLSYKQAVRQAKHAKSTPANKNIMPATFTKESQTTERLQPYLECIDSYLKPTAKNMLTLFLQMVVMLQKISCEVKNTG